MPIASVKGLNFHYEWHGTGETLVLVSGTGMSGEHWKIFQVPDLSKRFRVLTWDHRGTGQSDKPDEHYSTRMFADDCVGLLALLGVKRAHFLGHSMGGRVCQWIAIDHPEVVANMVLSGTGPGTSFDGQYYERGVPYDTALEMAEKGHEQYMADHFGSEFMFPPEFARDHPDQVQQFRDVNMKHMTPLKPYLRHVVARQEHETRDRLNAIHCPTLVICGNGDTVDAATGSHIDSSKVLAEGIAGAEFTLVEGGNHGYLRQMPEKANPLFIDFFERHPV
jgi:pimeloyl-ACP methyl ester carboxylesterase